MALSKAIHGRFSVEKHGHNPSSLQLAAWTVLIVSAACLGLATAGSTAANLKPGDIIYADSGNGIDGGAIIKVDPDSGEQTLLSKGNRLIQPFDLALDAQGQIVVSDTGQCCALIRIAPETGVQSVILDNSRNILGLPFGIAFVNGSGVLVANAQSLVRIDPTTGDSRTVSSGGQFVAPLGVTFADNSSVFVLNRASPPGILRVDLATGAQTIVSLGGYLNSPQAIVAANQDLYVTDVATPDGNFGIGRVIHVDIKSGVQAIIAEGGYLVGPVGIALGQRGQIVVGDPYTTVPSDPQPFNGGIIRIDARTGVQTLIARGQGGFVNPRGVAVVRGQ